VIGQLALAVPGALLLFAGAFVYYALRGPFFELPRSLFAWLVFLGGALVLGHVARLASVALAWGVAQFWDADLFLERAPEELVDELSPRRLGHELLDRLGPAVRSAFSVELPRIGRSDDEAMRDAKARALEEVVALARARAGVAAPERLALLEARTDGARALAGSLLVSAALVLGTALHDFFFARAIAHAFSSVSIVALGVALAFAALAALAQARHEARQLTVFVLLLGATENRKAA